MILETSEFIEQLQDEICRPGDSLVAMKKSKTTETASYRMTKYKYNEAKKALQAVNNHRMCLLDDFRE